MKKESMTTKVGGFLNRNSMYIALALVCAMCMGSTVFAVDALWNTLAGLIETWVTRLGAVVMLVGGVMFGLGWKSDDAEQKSRGISTIIEMATNTRLDCALSSAGYMRQAFSQALFYTRNRHAFGLPLVEQPIMTTLLADMALESEAATLLAMALASRFGSSDPLDQAWRRIVTPAAKFWNCKRAVSYTGEAMEVFGGNGYVETGPMGRLFREAPVNSIWEGSGNVMCLDVLRAISRNPQDAHLLLDHLEDVASQEAPLRAQIDKLRTAITLPPQELEREARRFTQRLALTVQASLMLQHASGEASAAFISSRFDPDWGPVTGVVCGSSDPASLLRAAWVD